MSATCYVLALALLTAPPGDAVPPTSTADWPALRDAVVGLAVEWEILDPREDRLARYERFAADINVLRQRRRDLAAAPRLADSQRFPGRGAAEELLSFNRAYRHSLERRALLETDQATNLHEALRETDRLRLIWDAVRDANCEVYYAPVRRTALLRLREQIGEAEYLAGHLPPHVPVWRFAEIK
ncbi:MAG: hypothetical protein ACJ8F7_22500 [Gemmataceae bacterium]